MHDDERRSPQHTRRLLSTQVQRAPEDTLDQLESQQARVRHLTAQVKQLQTALRAETVAKGKLSRQLKEREEKKSPGTAGQSGSTGTNPEPTAETAAHGHPETTGESGAETSPATTEPSTPAEELDLSALVNLLETQPSSTWLAAVLNRMWYREGRIRDCLELIDCHTELLQQMTAGQAQLVGKIRGTARLEEVLDRIVAQRSPGPAYVPEADRVMYCAYSTPVYHSNGYSIRTRGVVHGLRAAGADVFVTARAGYPWDMSSAADKPTRRRREVQSMDGVEYVHLPEGNLNTLRPDDYVQVAADAFVREARLRRPTLIQAASNFLNGLPALIAARRLGVPFVYEVRGLWEVTEASAKEGWEQTDRYAWQARMEAFVASQADQVLAITQETEDELVRRGVPAERIELLPNGVDTESFLPLPRDEAYAKKHGISLDVPVIGFAGSLVDYEGLDALVQAANILRGRKLDFQMVIAGSGGVYEQLKAYKTAHKLGSRVRFVGRRPSGEIPQLLSCVDIVACPRKSLPVTEMVSPLKPLEAFAASKPVVLSDVSPHRVLVGAGQERGELAAAGNPKALADALQRLLTDPELRTAKGRAGRLWAVDERQWSRLGTTVRGFHEQARRHHADDAGVARSVDQLRIGLIADEFTTKTLQRAATIVPLDRGGFRDQIDGQLDLVLIESAWSGNDGQWHRGVGYYSEDEDASLRELLALCRDRGVLTVFWNKEDPVHIERFRATGARVDHVFTTDAEMITRYLAEAHTRADGAAVTASSLPFYADPAVHNPLPNNRPYEDTVAYAGTFYGERYAQRSAQLTELLRAAKEHGLVIYDRQLAIPDSPYRFPPEFADDVHGALPYDQVLDSYKSHMANLNVNSVADSPTMFSRRVVEIAASGGVLISAWSRAITEVFDGQIPNTNNPMYWRAFLGGWANDPDEHLAEAWMQMRAVLRSHTVSSALILMARTAGVRVAGIQLPAWGSDALDGDFERVLNQSVPPTAVRADGASEHHWALARARGVTVLDAGQPIPETVTWWAEIPADAGRTWAEDLLYASLWGSWDALVSRHRGTDAADGRKIAVPGPAAQDRSGGMVLCRQLLGTESGPGAVGQAMAAAQNPVNLTVPRASSQHAVAGDDAIREQVENRKDAGAVLIAGHDLKFAQPWIDHLQGQGHRVLIDQWENHVEHDPARSQELLAQADTVFCEWGLGNAVWYSQRVRPGQRLVVRVHAQELRRPYLSQINHQAVDQYVFVGELMREAAIRSHGVPRSKACVIPNFVRAKELAAPKSEEAEFTLGLVGIVPQIKRLDRAVTVIEDLAQRDCRWRLRIKGKRPEDYAWMLRREDEMAWYNQCYARIEALKQRVGRDDVVVFDPHGDDMAQWFQGIGYALSVSDLESFHLTLPDGAASGAVPVSLAWPGADRIYPRDWLVSSLQDMSERIAMLQANPDARRELLTTAFAFVDNTMAEPTVFQDLDNALTGEQEKDPA